MLTLLLFVAGLVFGSFFNVVGLRLPRDDSLAAPPLRCVSCGQRLGPVDLVPAFGWLLRREKCRYCGEPIPAIYMVGEIATGLVFAWLPFIGTGAELGLLYVLAALVVIISVSDLSYRLIPNKIVYPAMLFFAVSRVWLHQLPAWQCYAGFTAGGGVLLLVSIMGVRMGKAAMGGGDVKMMALMGLALGIKLLLLCVFLSVVLGSIVGLILRLGKSVRAAKQIRHAAAHGTLPRGPVPG